MLLSSLLLRFLVAALSVAAHPDDSFHEVLTLHPLPDGKLSVLFEFTTYFTNPPSRSLIRKLGRLLIY